MSSRAVNDLLHTLRCPTPFASKDLTTERTVHCRGEQFRHAQNVQGSRSHIIASSLSCNSPTLPFLNIPQPLPQTAHPTTVSYDDPKWRARALSVVLSHSPPALPSLSILCLRILASYPINPFIHDIVPHLPPHLRRDLIRDSAVHSPLPNQMLYALYEPDGHADSEILIVGPAVELRDDLFRRTPLAARMSNGEGSWDMEDHTPEPLTTLMIISTRLLAPSLLSLPPTLTNIALVNLPNPVSVHRLPSVCPLLTILDLSFNTWLELEADAEKILQKVDWTRWSRLRVLGLRKCYLSIATHEKLNRGRWDEVDVIQGV